MLLTVKNLFLSLFKCENREQNLVALSVMSIFLPFYITAAFLLFVVVRAFFVKEVREKMLKGKAAILILDFAIINVFAPIYFRNYYGIACFVGVCAILLYALYVRTVVDSICFEKISNIILLMSITSAVCALFQRLMGTERVASVFFNPNYYGAIITFVILLCVYNILETKGCLALNIFAILANLLGLLLCNCQSAFFSIILGVFVLLLLTKKYKIIIVCAVLGLCALPLIPYILPRISGAYENISIRATIWNAGIRGFLDNPAFGRGMMGYMQIYEKFGGQKNFHCHNMFIDMLLSFGIVGCIPLVAFVVKPIAKAFKQKNALIISILAAVLLHSLVDVTLAFVQTGALAAVFIAIPYINEKTSQ